MLTQALAQSIEVKQIELIVYWVYLIEKERDTIKLDQSNLCHQTNWTQWRVQIASVSLTASNAIYYAHD